MTAQLQRMMKKLEGDGPIEKHILLLKLTEALENAPDFGDKAVMETSSPQRKWLSRVGALLSRLGIDKKVKFQSSFSTLAQYWKYAIVQIQGQVLDAIEEIKLELELEDRSDIGSAYAPGDVYRFFADLKDVVYSAESEVMIVDLSSVNYLGRFSGNYLGRLIPNFSRPYSRQFCDDNFHLRSE